MFGFLRKFLYSLCVIVLVAGCGGGGGTNNTTANTAPVASAGVDQSVATASLVTLNGSASSDADGDTLTYAWTMTGKPVGSTAVLNSTTVQGPTFTADLSGTYTLILVVDDGTVGSVADTVIITAAVPNTAPIANAGADQSVTTGATVTLDGSGSSDADADPLTYAWTMTGKPVGSTAVLNSPTVQSPTFIADLSGTYTMTLIVNDSTVNSTADTVLVTASAAVNNAPVASAGVDQSVNVLSTVTLNGSGSSDADSDPLTYAWSITNAPAGSTATLSNTAAVGPTFVPNKPGIYTVSLVVNDSSVNSAASVVTITVSRLIWKLNGSLMNGFGRQFALSSDESTIYTGHSNALWAINTTSGTLMWTSNVSTSIYGVAVSGGSIYALESSSSSPSKKLYAYNSTGVQLWSTIVGLSMYGPTVDASNNIYIGGYANVWIYNSTGGQELSISTGAFMPNYFTPIFDASGTIYFGGSPALLYAYNSSGVQQWTYSAGGSVYSPSLDDNSTTADPSDDIIYVGSADTKLHAVNAPDGSGKWAYPTGGSIYAQPIIGPDGTVYVGSADGTFYAINPDGTLKWSYSTGGTGFSVAALSADGTVYVGAYDKKLYAFNSDGTLKWTYLTSYQFTYRSGPIITSTCVIYVQPEGIVAYALYDDCTGPETARWPTLNRNNARTGR